MLCALTVRKLKPGAFDEFVEKFTPEGENGPPAGWKAFRVLRGTQDENEVITFGFFDGTLDEMSSSQDDHGYAERRAAIEPLVESVVVNGVYDVAKELIVS